MNIAILGAGLSGLTIAYLLNKEGYQITVFEKEKSYGGLCKTCQQDGFTFDIGGSHIIFSRNDKTLKFILKLLKDNVIKNKRNTKIFYKGNLVKYPFENGLGDLPKEERVECLTDYIHALLKRKEKRNKIPKNFYDWLYWKFGKSFAEKYMIPYNEKIWKYPLKKMNTKWVEGRIPDPNIKELIKASIGLESEGYSHQLFFYYPKKGGMQQLLNKLFSQINDKILFNQTLTRIEKKDKKWTIVSNNEIYTFDILISTIPVQELISIISNTPKEIKKASNELKYNSLINIFLALNRKPNPKFEDLSWMYIPEWKNGEFHRISFPSNFSKYNAPKDASCINVEITAKKNSSLWKEDDSTITSKVIQNLVKMNIITKKQILFKHITRWKYAYVIFDTEYEQKTDLIFRFLDKLNIFSYGRFAKFKYYNMDKVIEEATECVEKIKNYKGEY
ncbi:MAG: protoporphyrinogen/coproporphyrinogen oxidase [Candidatus Heimdallarchaeaceae archaeon]